MKELDAVSNFLWKCALSAAAIAVTGAVIVVCWDWGVKEVIHACGGSAKNISLWTGIFTGGALYTLNAYFSSPGLPTTPQQPQREIHISPEDREKVTKLLDDLGQDRKGLWDPK